MVTIKFVLELIGALVVLGAWGMLIEQLWTWVQRKRERIHALERKIIRLQDDLKELIKHANQNKGKDESDQVPPV